MDCFKSVLHTLLNRRFNNGEIPIGDSQRLSIGTSSEMYYCYFLTKKLKEINFARTLHKFKFKHHQNVRCNPA